MIVETPVLDQPTLDRFYRDVLQPSFPADQIMTLEEVRDAYLGANAQPAALLITDGKPIAGILAEWYPASSALLIGYLAVHRYQRGRGDGARLLAATLPKWQASLRPSLVLAEIDDPRFHAADAHTGDPIARVRFWSRAGARLLSMPYFQPSLRPGSPRVRDMLLISFGVSGHEIPGELVAAFLEEYFELCEGEPALADPELLTLLDWTHRGAGGVALWTLDRFSEVPRLQSEDFHDRDARGSSSTALTTEK